MKKFNFLSAVSVSIAVFVVVTSTGCGVKDFKPSKIFSLDNTWPFGDDEDEPEKGVPVRLVGAWTDTVHTKPGQKPQRGFGGRLMFYGAKDEKPILVDGQLVVYAFDETGRQKTDNKPTRRYVFPPDQIPIHMSKSDIGASYSFWLPWDEVGGPKTEVSLICRFEPKGGPVISGEQTRHLLPGPAIAETTAGAVAAPILPEGEPFRPAQQTLESLQSENNARVTAQQTSYQAATNPQAAAGGYTSAANAIAGAADRQMTVTSIDLPTNFQMPDTAAFAQPAATTTGQLVQPPAQGAAHPFIQQQQQQQQLTAPAQFQQPATGVQPIYQAAQPPVTTGAGLMQRVPGAQFQPGVMPQMPRPTMPAVTGPVLYSAPHQGFAMPQVGSQYVNQQAAVMQPAQPVIQQTGATMPVPGSQMIAAPQQQARQPVQMMPQQAGSYPVQQAYQQPNLQQLPAANNLRTGASSPTTATIPWR